MAEEKKRKHAGHGDSSNKKQRNIKQWKQKPKNGPQALSISSIEPGDAGIWATCVLGRERKCVTELRDLFQQYAQKLYGTELEAPHADDEADIEAEINAEIDELKKPTDRPLFEWIRLDTPCVMFFRTRKPINPVELVYAICKDAASARGKKTRFVLRLTPMEVMGRATPEDLATTAKLALAPHFHGEETQTKKFAIRPSFRNHAKILTREGLIKQVAEAVGPKHSVDLSHYDAMILVEVYKGICGIGVVGREFEEFKRFNLTELHDPSRGAGGRVADAQATATTTTTATEEEEEEEEATTATS